MPRVPRVDVGGQTYHVINRANARARIFHNDKDYADFEYLLKEMKETYDLAILAYTIMPNHWHLLLHSKQDGDLAKALQWLTTSHARRHHTRKGTIGSGHLYQGRYKSFPIKNDRHMLTVLKYIERNAVRAKLCTRVESWKWGSAYRRTAELAEFRVLISECPVPLPRNYLEWVNTAESSEELGSIRTLVNKAVPYTKGASVKYIRQ